jgi:hypothetical protein
MLQEAEITTLSENQCSTFGKKMKVDTKFEICAGRKLPKVSPKTFKRESEKKFSEVEEKNAIKSDIENDFLLGELLFKFGNMLTTEKVC